MQLIRLPSMFRRVAIAVALVLVTASSTLAGPSSYTVTRSFSEQTLCDETNSASTTVHLTGVGTGDPGDMVTIVETLSPGSGLANLDSLTVGVGQGGTVETVDAGGTGDSNVFEAVELIEHSGRPSLGTNNRLVHNGDKSYTSVAETGRDIWAPGDTFVFGYNHVDGDFDLSVRIDEMRHSTGVGCWGKYGIMARQNLSSTSAMAVSARNGPAQISRTLDGSTKNGVNACPNPQGGDPTDATGKGANFFSRSSTGSLAETGHGGVFPIDLIYLRLTRIGGTFRGYASDDPDVEEFPTDDNLWIETSPPAGYSDPDMEGEILVGFCNHEHETDGAQIQEIDFTLVKWDVGDGGASGTAGSSRRITWNVPRSTVTNGLSYTLENSGSVITAEHVGIVDDDSQVTGPTVSHTEGVQVRQVGSFTSRTIGETGAGSATHDAPSDTYTLTGGGAGTGAGGDNMNFLYRRVTGDFVATAQILSRNLNGSSSGTYGLMARQNCHPESRHEFMASDRSTDGTRHTERLDHIVPDPASNRADYIVAPGDVPGSPGSEAPAVPGNPSPATNPDHLMLVRTGSQVTSYVAWDDPGSPGQPFHWCLVGSTNHQDRSDNMFVGMAINDGASNPLSSIDFKMDIQSYSPGPESPMSSDSPIFTRDFDSESNGDFPDGAVLSSTRFSGPHSPLVRDGKLRMTEDGIANSSTAAYWDDPALANILETGFVAEFDVSASSTGTPGEGGTFAVIASGDDLLTEPDVEQPNETQVGAFQNRLLMEHPGRESIGDNNNTEYLGANSYLSTAETGRDVWAPGDTMEYAYNLFEGDFDLSVRIDDVNHTTGEGCWGKFGIMARETLDSNSRMCQISNHGPKGVVPNGTGACGEPPGPGSCANFFGRLNHLDSGLGGNMFEDDPVLSPCFAPYLRLKREGNVFRGYVSDDPSVENSPTEDSLWIRTGRDFNILGGVACWYVGFANHEHETAGTQVQEVEFTLIKWDGTPADDCTSTPGESSIGVFENVTLIEHPGRPALGPNNDVIHREGNSYTSIAETGQDIWSPGDTFVFSYNEFVGDFDLSVRIDEMRHTTGQGCWGKYGIMARQSLSSTSAMAVSARNGPAQISMTLDGTALNGAPECPRAQGGDASNAAGKGANFFSRTTGGGLAETGAGGEFPIDLVYLRLTRNGNTIRGYASANSQVERDPTNTDLWTQTSPGSGFNSTGMGSCLLVGFCNHEHSEFGAQIQEIDFTLIKWDGSRCGGPVDQPVMTTPAYGNSGAGLGFGGEVPSSQADDTNRLRQRNECRPMLSLEIDTSSRTTANRIHFAGVNNEGTGPYHIGLNTNSSTASRQINEQLGVSPGSLPDLFDPEESLHLKLEYQPNGQVRAWASPVQNAVNETLVIDTIIPPLTLGAGPGSPIVGFTAATGGNSQTLEFDNLTIAALSGDPVVGPVGTQFRRGDCDQSGKVDFNDSIFHLRFLFLGENEDTVNSCRDACDSDDSGTDDFTDDINSLRVLFLGQGAIPEPGPLPDESHPCGVDPTTEDPEELTCEEYVPVIACP